MSEKLKDILKKLTYNYSQVDNLKGVTGLVLGIVALVLIIAAAGLYYGSVTGFFLSPASTGNQINGNDSGLVVGTPVQSNTGSSTSANSSASTANQSTQQVNQSNQANRTTSLAGSSSGGSSGGGGGGDAGSPAPSCSNECPSGSKQCIGNYAQTCGNYDSDSCLDWSSGSYCQYGCTAGSCQQAPSTNGTYSFNVSISSAKGVYAVDFIISFEKGKISVVSVTDGEYLKQGGARTYPIISFDNSNGTISYASTRFNTTTEAIGNGSLTSINFVVLNNSTSELRLSGVHVVDNNLQNIPKTTTDGAITIAGGSVTGITDPAINVV